MATTAVTNDREVMLTQINELRTRVEEKDEAIRGLKNQLTNQVPEQSYVPRAREDWLEALRMDDPERYE